MNPVRIIWALRAGLIACLSVVPLAFIVGGFRQTPLALRLGTNHWEEGPTLLP